MSDNQRYFWSIKRFVFNGLSDLNQTALMEIFGFLNNVYTSFPKFADNVLPKVSFFLLHFSLEVHVLELEPFLWQTNVTGKGCIRKIFLKIRSTSQIFQLD
jgi:hypothetical protein